MFNKAYRWNWFELTYLEGKDNAMSVVQKKVVEKGQKEEVRKKILQMVHAAHLSTSLPLHPGVLDYPVLASLNPALQNVIVCKPVW